MATPHQILGVSSDASEKEIKKAYKKLAAKYHPDKNKDESAHKKFLEVQDAYEKLTNTNKTNQGFGSFYDDVTDSIFKRYRWEHDPWGQHRREETTPARIVPIDLVHCINGVNLGDYYSELSGVILQPGIKEGDVFFHNSTKYKVVIRKHPRFTIQGNDLHISVKLTSLEVSCGIDVIVEMPDGNKIKFKAPDSTMRCKGLGIPHFGNPGKSGDLIIKPVISTDSLTQQQKDAIISIVGLKNTKNV